MTTPLILCILDGFGIAEPSNSNACFLANTPCLDQLNDQAACCELMTSGIDVGLPDGQMGNSEVGHMNIGCGRIVLQDLPKINQAIENDSLASNIHLTNFIAKLHVSNGACHLMGMYSKGGVHSYASHLIYLAKTIASQQIKVFLHLFADGRDNMPGSFLAEIGELLTEIKDQKLISIATITGRYFAMDRDNRWDRTELSYLSMVMAEGKREKDIINAIQNSYEQGKMDEFMLPSIIGDYAGMADGDAILMANFRADRVRQILSSLVMPDFAGFKRNKVINFAASLGLSEYGAELNKYLTSIIQDEVIDHSIGQIIASLGLKQLRIAETEKYAHVTFFFNAGIEQALPGEDRILINSPKVATYDLAPEMSACEMTDKLIEAIISKKYALIVVNFANCDMVGHSGNLDATIVAVETIDHCLARIKTATENTDAVLLITADHGNAEAMQDLISHQPLTSHSLNPVPLIIYGPNINKNTIELKNGKLSDIAPTMLKLMKIEKPKQMTGESLIVKDVRE